MQGSSPKATWQDLFVVAMYCSIGALVTRNGQRAIQKELAKQERLSARKEGAAALVS